MQGSPRPETWGPRFGPLMLTHRTTHWRDSPTARRLGLRTAASSGTCSPAAQSVAPPSVLASSLEAFPFFLENRLAKKVSSELSSESLPFPHPPPPPLPPHRSRFCAP